MARPAAELDPGIFRAYDVRGVAGRELTAAGARALGLAYGRRVRAAAGAGTAQAAAGAGTDTGATGAARAAPEVPVGRDNRRSSPELAAEFMAGLATAGCRPVDLGLVTTPVLYFARWARSAPGAAMVTASHNPPEYNGFKLGAPGHGDPAGMLAGDDLAALGAEARALLAEAEAAAAGEPAAGAAGAGGGPDADPPRWDPLPDYFRDLAERIRLASRRPTVVVDCGSGSAAVTAPAMLERWGCRVIRLYCDPDPDFPHHFPDPTKPDNLRDLQAAVRRHGADLGLAFDGDADRLGVVDERGDIVWGDRLMILFWREILARRPGAPAIVEVKCSQRLVEEIERLGGRPMFHPTGHSLVKASLRRLGAPFAGEMSGHYFFADEFPGYDDALYAAGRLLRVWSADPEGRTLSALLADVPAAVGTPEVRVACPDARKFAVVAGATARLVAEVGRERVVTVDGARLHLGRAWGLVRASNTEPSLVVRCEGPTADAVRQVQALLDAALVAEGVGPVAWPPLGPT